MIYYNLRRNYVSKRLNSQKIRVSYRCEESYLVARKRIADMEKKGEIITMGTLVDEIERNKIIEAAKSSITLGATNDFVLKFLMMNLDLSEKEAKVVFEEEVK